MTSSAHPSSALKRKLSSVNMEFSESAATAKKPKMSTDATETQPKQAGTVDAGSANALLYCHQCSRGLNASDVLPCTFLTSKGGRCNARYCKACLRNRYDMDMDSILKRGRSGTTPKDLEGHITTSGHVFKCPRCKDVCNCRRCRKSKGLEPTGKMEPGEVVNAVSKDVQVKGKKDASQPSKPKAAQPKSAQSKPTQAKTKGTPAQVANSKGKAKAVPTATKAVTKTPYIRKPKPKPAPRVFWQRVPVPPSFTLEHALQRLHIHDFVLRFSPFFDLSRAQLDELADVGGRRASADDDVDDAVEDPSVAAGWVTEPCVRGILLGLLLLVKESEALEDTKPAKTAVDGAINAARAKLIDVNLSRLWTAIAGLRPFLDIPDPLPPPAGTRGHLTRSGAQTGIGGVSVVAAAQLVPVVAALVGAALGVPRVKEELDEGVRRAKELPKDERERAKAEKERWDAWRTVKENIATKEVRDQHKRKLVSFGTALSVAQQANALRFAPLGMDHAGRTFVVAAPGATEREATAALLAGDTQRGGKTRARATVSVHERNSLRRWGWFVAVHGERPPDALVPPKPVDEDSSDDEGAEDGARWWGFSQPAEIRKLADWVAHANGLDEAAGEDKRASSASAYDSAKHGSGSRSGTAAGSRSTSSGATAVVREKDGLGPLSPLSTEDDESEVLTPLSSGSGDDEPDVEPLSPLTSNEEDEDEDYMARRKGASRQEIQRLVQSLREYADVLEWRVWRMEPDEDAEKGKVVKAVAAIKPERFYG